MDYLSWAALQVVSSNGRSGVAKSLPGKTHHVCTQGVSSQIGYFKIQDLPVQLKFFGYSVFFSFYIDIFRMWTAEE